MAKKSKAAAKSSGPAINIGIGEEDRAAIAGGLSRLLADSYTLYLTTHNFHWNVTGPMFNTLHAMFMAQYTELWNAVDPIAERIRSLARFTGAGLVRAVRLARFDQGRADPTAQGDGDGENPRRRPRSGGTHRTQRLPAGRRRWRCADRGLTDPAPDGARADGLDAALAARRLSA
jgi:hypothetical protein